MIDATKLALCPMEVANCPLCGGHAFTQLARVDRYRFGIQTVGCKGCGLVLTNPQPTEEALKLFYEKQYRVLYQRVQEPSVGYIRAHRKDERALEMAHFLRVHNLLSPEVSVLDIGAAEGSALRAIRTIRPDARLYGVEPSIAFCRFASLYVPCRVYTSVEELRASENAKFSLVILNHVLEHMKSPVKSLQVAATLLTQEGVLYVGVPSITEYRDIGSLHPAHLWHFSMETLGEALEAAGFHVELIEKHRPIMHPPSLRATARLKRWTQGCATTLNIQTKGAVRKRPEHLGWGNIRFIAATSRLFNLRRVPFISEMLTLLLYATRGLRRLFQKIICP